MPPSKLYIKVKALERLIKEEKNYLSLLSQQKENYTRLSRSKNTSQSEIKVANELVLETAQLLIPQLYLKIEQFANDLEAYLNKHDVPIRTEVDNYLKTKQNHRKVDMKVFDAPLDSHRRNVKLNNDIVSSTEALDLEEFDYMKERIIYLFLACSELKRKRYEEFNAKIKEPRQATLEDAVNDDEIY